MAEVPPKNRHVPELDGIRGWRIRLLAKIGLISYALYMYHQSVNGLTHGLLFNQEPQLAAFSHFLASILVISISILLATLSYIYYETSIRKFGHRLSDSITADARVSRAAAA
jgi:peptidoglycan/LPS O-acetylase OafA/YrhL